MRGSLREEVSGCLSLNGALGAPAVVGVSGGVDSIVLLHVVHQLGGPVVCAHVDHGIRPSSADDANFVASVCRELGVSFESTRLSPPNTGIEAWGRAVRYRFFTEVCERCSANWILTAHTADDQIETVLMRLLQNREPIGVSPFDQKRRLIRPLLGVHKAELIEYARTNGLSWREDESNLDNSLLRNKVRNEYLPAMLAAGSSRPDLLNLVNSLTAELREHRRAADLLSASLGEFGTKSWLRGLVSALKALPEDFQWRVAEAALLHQIGFRLGQDRAKLVVDFVLNGRLGIQLPGGTELRRKEGGLVALRPEKV